MPDAQLLALSPLDGRYARQGRCTASHLLRIRLIRARVKVEVEWLLALANEPGIVELQPFPTRRRCACARGEGFLHHRRRADQGDREDHQPRRQGRRIPDQGAPGRRCGAGSALEFVHFACTSEDINNLSYALMLDEARRTVMLPRLDALIAGLRAMAHAHAALPMLSRTHGQTASPTTVGKEFANVVARLARQRDVLATLPMPGKINGAVGNYNAHAVAYPDVDWPRFSQVSSLSLAWTGSPTPRRSSRTTASPSCATRRSASARSASTCVATSGAISRWATSGSRSRPRSRQLDHAA